MQQRLSSIRLLQHLSVAHAPVFRAWLCEILGRAVEEDGRALVEHCPEQAPALASIEEALAQLRAGQVEGALVGELARLAQVLDDQALDLLDQITTTSEPEQNARAHAHMGLGRLAMAMLDAATALRRMAAGGHAGPPAARAWEAVGDVFAERVCLVNEHGIASGDLLFDQDRADPAAARTRRMIWCWKRLVVLALPTSGLPLTSTSSSSTLQNPRAGAPRFP